MQYEPVKKIFGNIIRKHPSLRKIFYKILGTFFLREWYVKRELCKLLKTTKENAIIYDAGCGFGQYSYFIAKNFPNASIYSIDIKNDYIEDCKAFFNRIGLKQCRFEIEDLTKIQHQDKFDIVLSIDVVEHITDDTIALQNFFRALKPNGFLLLTTPSNFGGSNADKRNKKGFIDEHARNGYSVQELETKLKSAGFSIDSIQYTYGFWGKIAWKLSIKIPMLLMNRSKIFLIILPVYYLIASPFIFIGMFLDFISHKKTGSGLLIIARKKIK